METNWLRPQSLRVIPICLITSSSSAACRSISTSHVIVLSKPTPSGTEMLGGTWQIWITHLYFPLTFRCRHGLIGFWEQSQFLWIISSHKRCSEPFGLFSSCCGQQESLVFHCTFLAVPAVPSKTFLSLMFFLFLTLDALVVSCSWCFFSLMLMSPNDVALPSKQAELEIRSPIQQMVQIQCWPCPHLSAFALLIPTCSSGRGCWWFSWAQTWAHLHLLLLIPSYHHTCSFPCSETSAEGAVSLEPGVMIWGGECWE